MDKSTISLIYEYTKDTPMPRPELHKKLITDVGMNYARVGNSLTELQKAGVLHNLNGKISVSYELIRGLKNI